MTNCKHLSYRQNPWRKNCSHNTPAINKPAKRGRHSLKKNQNMHMVQSHYQDIWVITRFFMHLLWWKAQYYEDQHLEVVQTCQVKLLIIRKMRQTKRTIKPKIENENENERANQAYQSMPCRIFGANSSTCNKMNKGKK